MARPKCGCYAPPCSQRSRQISAVNPSLSRAGSRGDQLVAANDLLATFPVPLLSLRKSSTSSLPSRNPSSGSLTIPQLLGPNHQWDEPRNTMVNDL